MKWRIITSQIWQIWVWDETTMWDDHHHTSIQHTMFMWIWSICIPSTHTWEGRNMIDMDDWWTQWDGEWTWFEFDKWLMIPQSWSGVSIKNHVSCDVHFRQIQTSHEQMSIESIDAQPHINNPHSWQYWFGQCHFSQSHHSHIYSFHWFSLLLWFVIWLNLMIKHTIHSNQEWMWWNPK